MIDQKSKISVRDYFAAHAPITLADARLLFAANKGARQIGEPANPTYRELIAALAELRLLYADAMLAASEES